METAHRGLVSRVQENNVYHCNWASLFHSWSHVWGEVVFGAHLQQLHPSFKTAVARALHAARDGLTLHIISKALIL